MKKVGLFFVVFFSLVSFGFASGDAEANSINIGGIFPLSGPSALYGKEARQGVELAIAEINAEGGLNGRPLRLIAEDDEGNPEKTVNAYKKLTSRNKVTIIIGSLTSPCTLAITKLAQAQRVVLMVPASTTPSITDAGNYVFRACFVDSFQGTLGAIFAADNLKLRAAVLYDNANNYSVGLKDNFEAAFRSRGGNIVASESYTTRDVDFNAQITKIRSASPDVVYLPDYYSTVSLIVKQLRAQGIDAPVLGADGWDGITENAGDEILNGFYSTHYNAAANEPAVVEFVNAYRAKYRTTPFSFAALGYDSMRMIKDAIVRAGSIEGPAVRDALEKTNGSYVTGKVVFDEKRNPRKSAFIIEIVKNQNGKLAGAFRTMVNP
jgi:branched-chain amino acid transport system substrate-binding protein